MRFLGYDDRGPYLCYVDLETTEITPAAPRLETIPQGIDEVVVLDDAVAIRCGADWLGLSRDLTSAAWRLDDAHTAEARRRSRRIDLLQWNDGRARGEWTLPVPGGATIALQSPRVTRWSTLEATVSPDGTTVALGGSTAPVRPSPPLGEMFVQRRHEPEPWVLALVDVATGAIRICDGEFDNFCYPPAWSADSTHVAFGAPFQPRRLYVADRDAASLTVVRFRRDPPMPLIDGALLDA